MLPCCTACGADMAELFREDVISVLRPVLLNYGAQGSLRKAVNAVMNVVVKAQGKYAAKHKTRT